MTNINSVSRDYSATRNFLDDTRPLDTERGFLDMDSTAHAMIDQANLGNDNTSIYGITFPAPAYQRYRSKTASGSAQAPAPAPPTLGAEIHIPTSGNRA
ncbi:hypothetical protein [Bordetella sp. N]|uniref:hypothetical protein n=1 Tax=Bordetella sp. N TaxID=1746199 RepID=UPI000709B4D8|nr:hypothetical protein [Bordetella sp. N]ALM81623.1 hypothetical protein ASB57_00365 [Bordetella sp. N]